MKILRRAAVQRRMPALRAMAGWGCHASDASLEIDSIAPRPYRATRMRVDLARQ